MRIINRGDAATAHDPSHVGGGGSGLSGDNIGFLFQLKLDNIGIFFVPVAGKMAKSLGMFVFRLDSRLESFFKKHVGDGVF